LNFTIEAITPADDAAICQIIKEPLNKSLSAPFGTHKNICELKKLFLLPQARGKGIGRALSIKCLSFAQAQGFKGCYLDTLENMTSAISLYEALGFKHLDAPLDGTEHNGCDVWMLKTFSEY